MKGYLSVIIFVLFLHRIGIFVFREFLTELMSTWFSTSQIHPRPRKRIKTNIYVRTVWHIAISPSNACLQNHRNLPLTLVTKYKNLILKYFRMSWELEPFKILERELKQRSHTFAHKIEDCSRYDCSTQQGTKKVKETKGKSGSSRKR